MKPTQEKVREWVKQIHSELVAHWDCHGEYFDRDERLAELAASWGAEQAQQTTEPELPDDEPSDAEWDKVDPAFTEWWNAEYDDTTNPFRIDSLAYWAWAAWKAAGVRAGMAQSQDKKDAERYRFIRDANRSDCISYEISSYAMETLDEYVDAAIEDEAAMQGGQQP